MGQAAKNQYRKPYKFKTNHMSINRNMYNWADNLFFDEIVSASILHTLKAIIATRHLSQPTIQQINEARSRSSSKKFAQSDSVSNRTIRRHIQILEKLKYINVKRQHQGWDSRNAYSICVPAEYLVVQRGDTMSPSISCSNSLPEGERVAIHPFQKQTKKREPRKHAPAGMALSGPAAGVPTEPIEIIKFKPKTEAQLALGKSVSEQIKQDLREKLHGR